ncbi:hypothetical protein JAAARDRAFT_188517 [Jaapia argillacea MUCL 33604]|uniref:Uncharacterized protein n=1 Tax=Jaapia argillacea MUCL 33604 TaxID=933084 RepID=A0A067QH74_9AGAM|nr:hypothetical protein JAAARDRAFT_188517 [Jaapia argillacea MUCL 33604]
MQLRENWLWDIFFSIEKLMPRVLEQIATSIEEYTEELADLLRTGQSKARSEDANSLRTAIIKWVPKSDNDKDLQITQKSKTGHGFHHSVYALQKGTAQINNAPVDGSEYPNFVYDGKYNCLAPVVGFMKSPILVKAFKHIYTSPSSAQADKGESQATCTGNAALHSMTSITPASLAYTACQVKFALSAAPVFKRNDKMVNSVNFFNSLMRFFYAPQYVDDVKDLLAWWDRRVFPQAVLSQTATGSFAQMLAARGG